MGQCRSKLSEILPSPSDYRRKNNRRNNNHKGRDRGIFSLDASFSESSYAVGGQGLLMNSDIVDNHNLESAGDDVDGGGGGGGGGGKNKKKKSFDYYGGMLEDSTAEEEDDDAENRSGSGRETKR